MTGYNTKEFEAKVKIIKVKIIESLLIILTSMVLTYIFCSAFASLMVLPLKNLRGRACPGAAGQR